MSGPTAHPMNRLTPEAARFDRVDARLVPAYQAMDSRQRLAAGFAACALVRARLEAHLRGTRPEWSEEEVKAEIARRYLRDAR